MSLRQHTTSLATWFTKLLHLDVRFYGRSFAWMSVGQASGVIRGVATTFLMARWLPRDILGEFRYILAIFGLAGIFSFSGINASIIRAVSKGDTVVARVAAGRIFKISLLGALALFVMSFERYAHAERLVAASLAVAAFTFPLYSVCGIYGAILTGKEEIPRLVKIAVINNVLFASAFVFVLWKSKTLLAVTVAYFGFDILFRGLMSLRELHRLPVKGSVKDHLKLGEHMSFINIFQTVAGQLDQFLIQRFAGYGTLANFSVATLIPEQIKDFVNAMGGILLKRFSRHEETGSIVKQTRRHFWMVMAGSALIVLAYAIAAPIFIPWFFPQYKAQVFPSIIYALGLLALPALVGQNFFQAHNRIKRLWLYYTANAFLQIGSNLALIPFFGAWGAIASKTGTRLASLAFSYPSGDALREARDSRIPIHESKELDRDDRTIGTREEKH